MKKTRLTILFAIICLPFLLNTGLVIAEEPSFIFKQDQNVDLKIPCETADGELCPSDTNCTITVYDKRSNLIVNDENMSFSTMYFNRTIPRGQHLETGEYNVIIHCVAVGGDARVLSFNYEITPTGERTQLISLEIMLILLFYAILLFAILREEYPIGMIGAMGILAMGAYTVLNGLQGFNNIYTQLFSIVNMAIGGYLLLRGTFEEISTQGGQEWRG